MKKEKLFWITSFEKGLKWFKKPRVGEVRKIDGRNYEVIEIISEDDHLGRITMKCHVEPI